MVAELPCGQDWDWRRASVNALSWMPCVPAGSMNLPLPDECGVPPDHADMCILRIRRNHLIEARVVILSITCQDRLLPARAGLGSLAACTTGALSDMVLLVAFVLN